MPEIRQNRATKEWVIIATERAKRPDDFQAREEKIPVPAFDPDCPFCPGNESRTPGEIVSFRQAGTQKDKPGWWVRIIPNKFAAVSPGVELMRETEGFFLKMGGYGRHEVIIESPQHNLSLGNMRLKQVEEVCLVYRERYIELSAEKDIKIVIIFRNHGKAAGTSLVHPHSQLIAMPLVPTHIRHLLEEATRYYDDHGSCVFCDMIKEELEFKKRVILETESFVAFSPFASQVPFGIWIVPKEHNAGFGNITTDEAKKLAFILREVLSRLHTKLSDPDYNLVLHTAPIRDSNEDFYHWYIQILPRLTTPAGFELGSGVYINTSLPEETAEFLKG
ncbi:MAG: galactose-1-phosphate uridylyltransferase [candidate division Zixibacteria bacterium]|nr:galactose-1-phosphate uridylyltransferase [candidate division Zixibacteria bacterium]